MTHATETMTPRRPGTEQGFSLLEVMVALAILGLTLVPIIQGYSQGVSAAQHAKLLTVATQLAREKMLDYETQIGITGYCLNDEITEGDFTEDGYARFKWKISCEKVELPAGDKIASGIQQASQSQPGGPTSAGGLSGSGASGVIEQAQGQFAQMASQIPFIQNILETAVRRVTLTVHWVERGRTKEMSVAQYFVDLKSVQAFAASTGGTAPGGSGPGGTQQGQGSGNGPGSGGLGSGGINSGSTSGPGGKAGGGTLSVPNPR
jgi:general secretion pathway protein I